MLPAICVPPCRSLTEVAVMEFVLRSSSEATSKGVEIEMLMPPEAGVTGDNLGKVIRKDALAPGFSVD